MASRKNPIFSLSLLLAALLTDGAAPRNFLSRNKLRANSRIAKFLTFEGLAKAARFFKNYWLEIMELSPASRGFQR